MKKTINQFKQFLRSYQSRRQPVTVASSVIIDLNAEEKVFVNMQSDRMILRKTARQQRLDPARDWTALLPLMPHRGSAYALRAGR